MIQLDKIIQPTEVRCDYCNTPHPVWHVIHTPRDCEIHYDFCPLCLNRWLLIKARDKCS